MNLGRIATCSVLALALAAPAAYAQDDDLGVRRPSRQGAEPAVSDPARTGVYVGLGGTYAMELFDGPGSFDNGFGFNVRLGNRLHKHFAAELEIEKFNGFSGQAGAEYDSWIIGLNGKAFVLTDKWQPFFLAGIGFVDGELSGPVTDAEEDFALRFGGGLDWYFRDNVVASVDLTYLLHTGDLSDFDALALSFGIQYRP
jgi:opacity protein-like surface antigen